MASDIYAKPDFSKKVRHNQPVQDDRGWEEMDVDIYQNTEGLRDDATDRHTLDGGLDIQSRPPGQKPAVGAALLSLGVLNLLMVAGIISLAIFFALEKHQLETEIENLSRNYSQTWRQVSDLEAKNRQVEDEVKRLKEKTEDLRCPRGWTRFRRSCYLKLTQKKSWSNTERDCENKQSQLVVVDSEEEQEFLAQLSPSEEAWIGLRTPAAPGARTWTWLDGSPLTLEFWSTEQDEDPRYPKSATCCDQQGKWKRRRYEVENKGICEKQALCLTRP